MQEITLNTESGLSKIVVGEGLTSGLSGLSSNTVLLIDENVLSLHSEKFSAFRTISIPRGEENKTLQTVEKVYRELVGMEIDRSSMIVGIGGGLTTDVAGFIASTYLRGVRFGFISTTLLGQVDASIGGKNGVNIDGYKNMIGVIRQPEFIWCDYALLDTLDDKEFRSGIAEIIKYGIIKDPAFLLYINEHMSALLNREGAVLEEIISKCVQIKADIVQKDERESGDRRLLNFGHTMGHAIERNYRLLHGEAISIGMVIAANLSAFRGFISENEALEIQNILSKAGLPVSIDLDEEIIYETFRKDKKKEGSAIHFIFIKAVGEAFSGELELSELKDIFHDLLKHSK